MACGTINDTKNMAFKTIKAITCKMSSPLLVPPLTTQSIST